jgi:hypothetical protein
MPTAVSSFGTHVLSLRRVISFVGVLDSGTYVCHVHCEYYIPAHGKSKPYIVCFTHARARALSRSPSPRTPLLFLHTHEAPSDRPGLEPANASSSPPPMLSHVTAAIAAVNYSSSNSSYLPTPTDEARYRYRILISTCALTRHDGHRCCRAVNSSSSSSSNSNSTYLSPVSHTHT